MSDVLTAEDVRELAPLYDAVVLALKQVYDPEIPVNIYDLGLIYELNINKEHEVYIKMTFTAPNCPMADEVMAEIAGIVALYVGPEWMRHWGTVAELVMTLDECSPNLV